MSKVSYAKGIMQEVLKSKSENLVKLKFDLLMAEKNLAKWYADKPSYDDKKVKITELKNKVAEIKQLPYDKAKKEERKVEVIDYEKQIADLTDEVKDFETTSFTYVTREKEKMVDLVNGATALIKELKLLLNDQKGLEFLAE
jgi:Fe-S-cluster formation regulator IscX/YfhJ